QGNQVERSVIAERLLVSINREVLLDPPCPHRVQTESKHEREEQIEQRVGAEGHKYERVKRQHGQEVQAQPMIEVAAEPEAPPHCEEREQQQPNRLAVPSIARHAGLEMVRHIEIDGMLPLMGMMFVVKGAKSQGARNDVR